MTDQRNLLAMILSGGGRGDPYANEASGPFASSPRIYGGQAKPQGKAAATDQTTTGSVPVPADKPAQKPKGGGQYDLPPKVPVPLSRPGGPGGGTDTGQPPTGTPYQNIMPNVPLPDPGGPGGGTFTGQPPPYPTIASDQTGFPMVPPNPYAEGQMPVPSNILPNPYAQGQMPNVPLSQPHRPYSPTPQVFGANVFPPEPDPGGGFWWQQGQQPQPQPPRHGKPIGQQSASPGLVHAVVGHSRGERGR